jgi:hypothetical protein
LLILSIDPGETSGFTLLNETDTLAYDKTDKKLIKVVGEKEGFEGFASLIEKYSPKLIVYEEFKLYPWKARQKSWSTFPTVQVIGVLKYLAEKNNIKIIGQGADIKTYFDDKKLKWCEVYEGYSSHERDAIRHGLYYIEFGEEGN